MNCYFKNITNEMEVIFFVAFLIIGASGQNMKVITKQCLGCICYGRTKCEIGSPCVSEACGPFGITKGYWIDAGKPTLPSFGLLENDDKAFMKCAMSLKCSSKTVEGYMKKFPRDCTGDGKVDCDDYARMHTYSGYGDSCKNALPENFAKDYTHCKETVGGLPNFIPPSMT